MDDKTYRDFIRDTIVEIIEITKDASIYKEGEFNNGYISAIYSIMNLIETQSDAFGVSKNSIGMEGFSADNWFHLRRKYWNL